MVRSMAQLRRLIKGRPYGAISDKKRRQRFKQKAKFGRQMNNFGNSGRNPVGFPKKQLVHLRYNQNFLLNPSNISTEEYCFRANSIFDPDQTGGGHQPIGHDQWALFYSTYVVVGSVITITVVHNETSTKANSIVGVLLNQTSSLPGSSTPSTVQEQGLGTWRILQGTQGGNVVKLIQKFSAKKFFDVTNVPDNSDRIGAAFGSNPPSTGDAFFIVWAAATIPSGNAPSSIEFSIQIDYSVLMSDPVPLTQS